MAQGGSYRAVFAVGEFRVLYVSQVLSVVGDQLSRVALSVLVFERTASAGLTALTYALTYLPDLVAGPLLSGLADLWPRRGLMVAADVARAALVPVMAVAGLPLWLVCGVLVVVQCCGAPHRAARSALLAEVLRGEAYATGLAASNSSVQVAQVAGFAVGGTVVAGWGVGPTLLVDAATFAASAVLVAVGLHARPRPSGGSRRGSWSAGLVAGSRLVWGVRRLRALVALACIAGFCTAAEGVLVPYSAQVGAGPVTAGLLLAAAPLGTAGGMLVLARFAGPALRLRLMGPLAVAAAAPLVLFAAEPGPVAAGVLLGLSGVASAYQLAANAAFVQAVPDAQRGQAFGLAVTALQIAQGLGIGLAGWVAEQAGPGRAIAVAGAAGVVAAAGAWRSWHRSTAPVPVP